MENLFSFNVPSDIGSYRDHRALYKEIISRALIILGFPISAFFVFFNLYHSRYVIAILVFGILVGYFVFLYYFTRASFSRKRELYLDLAIRIVFFFTAFYLFYDLVLQQNTSRMPWFMIFPAMVFYLAGLGEAMIWSTVVGLVFAHVLFNLDLDFGPEVVGQLKPRMLLIFGLLGGFSFVTSGVIRSAIRNLFEFQEKVQSVNKRLSREVEERKAAEEALRAREDQVRELHDSVSDYIITHDLEGRFLSVNRAAEKHLQYRPDEIVGRPIPDLIPERRREAFYREYLPGILEAGSHEGLLAILDKSGEEHVIEYRNTLVRKQGEPSFVSGVGRDITERVKSRREVKVLQRQVQQAQRMEAVGTLAGGIAHNFNNLLMGIQGYTSLMLLETDEEHPFHPRLKSIEALVRSGSNLSGQLLGYAREGKYEIRAVSLNRIVQKTSETFEATKKDIVIHRELAEDLRAIQADKAHIEQILFNLFINAADAMPGGGHLFVRTANVSHEDLAGKSYPVNPGEYVFLTVRDTGKGMEPTVLERIFEPFFTTKGLARGTGLGLASVYGIVKGHGGYIDVESEPGRGTTFFIYLPAAAKSEKAVPRPAEALARGTETVLLVDDEETVLDTGTQLLEALGYRVLTARNGREAVEVFEADPDAVDLVILDVVMPEMGGGEAFDRLKALDPAVKVLLSSGYSLSEEAGEVMKRGCDGFIQKPFHVQALSAKLREILDRA